ncbi:hypothetical protein Pcinc_020934 [Petrolisthes cinctipes]|uniref:Uncharacterized protein n=1 Tax=Petrolisthes cinctipes TaxID=88211 RepID=A0AAE1FLF7_PETCI|nr:hypothetical protein Pcinc_020934 [Petrolisthes cinctipes]
MMVIKKHRRTVKKTNCIITFNSVFNQRSPWRARRVIQHSAGCQSLYWQSTTKKTNVYLKKLRFLVG